MFRVIPVKSITSYSSPSRCLSLTLPVDLRKRNGDRLVLRTRGVLWFAGQPKTLELKIRPRKKALVCLPGGRATGTEPQNEARKIRSRRPGLQSLGRFGRGRPRLPTALFRPRGLEGLPLSVLSAALPSGDLFGTKWCARSAAACGTQTLTRL